jgi:hypothetical protein
MSNTNTKSASGKQSQDGVSAKQALRAARLSAVQEKLLAVARATRAAGLAARKIAIQHTKQQAYMMAVQQLAAQYGVAPVTQQVRSVAGTQKHAPSTKSGACKQVHALAQEHNFDRAKTLAACIAAGINPATAATQFAIAKRNSMQ